MQLTLTARGALRPSFRALLALALFAAPAAAASDLVEVAQHGVPEELESGVRRTVSVELANNGDAAWDPGAGYALSYHWLDAAGYSDSEGIIDEDRIRPNAWRHRDAVIRAFNADKPYDRFLTEQLAGDELVDYRNVREVTQERYLAYDSKKSSILREVNTRFWV